MDSHKLKDKAREVYKICRKEITKTHQIGLKLFDAAKTNDKKNDAIEDIGLKVIELITEHGPEIFNTKLSDPKFEQIISLYDEVKGLDLSLSDYEREIQNLKKDHEEKDSPDEIK